MRTALNIVVCTLGLLVAGCAGGMRAPVVENGVTDSDTNAVVTQSSQSTDESEPLVTQGADSGADASQDVVVTALEDEDYGASALDEPESLRDDPVNPAVVALLNNANEQVSEGQHAQAAASLERALKIDPKNAWLWHRLARTRLDLGELEQAQSLAARSNSYAEHDRRLLAENWLLIAQARRLAGDAAGAKAAQLRAEQFAKS